MDDNELKRKKEFYETEATDLPEVEATDIPKIDYQGESTDVPDATVLPEQTDVPDATDVSESTDIADVTDVSDGGDWAESTSVPEVGAIANPEGTDIPDSDDKQQKGILAGAQGDIYIIDANEFETIGTISYGITGEADILKVVHEDKQYALKLYKGKHEPNEEVLKRILSLGSSGFFVPLYSYGVCIRKSDRNRFSYELMDFVNAPSLAQIDTLKNEDKFRLIALNAAVCIDLCHKKKILHKDIKPGNFFLINEKKGSLMIADFGISTIMDDEGFSYTLQSGTTTYNAPEMYNADRNRVRLSAKTDFYSLGILLMSLWMGEKRFRAEMGDKMGKDRIFDLRAKKAKGNLPYPTDMSPNLSLLIKGLTVPDEENRWGFNEVVKWWKGELKTADISVTINDKPFIFNENKGLVAKTPQEMTACIMKDKEFAIKILKRGNVSKWLHDCNRDNMAIYIDDIVEREKNNDACVMMAAYTLDPTYPFIGDTGTACATLEEIAKEILHTSNTSHIINNRDSSFYCYLKAHGRSDLSTKCIDVISRNKYNPAWEIAVTLDANIPYVGYADNLQVVCNTISELVDYFYRINVKLSNEEKTSLFSDTFVRWLQARDEEAVAKIQQLFGIANDKSNSKPALKKLHYNDIDNDIWGVIYNLDITRSYELTAADNNTKCHRTYDDVIDLINDAVIAYYDNRATANDVHELLMVDDKYNPKRTRMFYYLSSKGKDPSEITSFIKNCYSDSANRCSPYNDDIALWKSLKGIMGKERNPRYLFKDSNKSITSIEEIKNVSPHEIEDEIENGCLSEWLTVFFHENPFADLSAKGTFEDLVCKYIDFIGGIAPKYEPHKRLNIARQTILKSIADLRRGLYVAIAVRALLLLLFIVPISFLLFSLYTYGITFDIDYFAVRKTEFILYGLTFGCATGIAAYLSVRGPIILDVLVGGTLGGGLFYLFTTNFTKMYPYMGWIAFAWIIIFCVLFLFVKRRCFKIDFKGINPLLKIDQDMDAMTVQPAYYAFDDVKVYDFREKKQIHDHSAKLKRFNGKLTSSFIPIEIYLLVVVYLYIMISPVFSGHLAKSVDTGQFNGVWEGEFEGHPAALSVKANTTSDIRVIVYVKFKKSVSEVFKGTYDADKSELTLTDSIPDNAILDGDFKGSMNVESKIYTGSYTSRKTKKNFEFKFTKNEGSK